MSCNHGSSPWHAVAKVCLEERWIKLDASFDRWFAIGRETDAVNFDGIHDALVPQRDWHQHQNYEILEESQLFIDIPIYPGGVFTANSAQLLQY